MKKNEKLIDEFEGLSWRQPEMTKEIKAYCKRLINRRTALGLRPAEVAKMLDMSINTIQSWENGQLPRGEYLLNLCKALKCSPNWLMGVNTTEKLIWPTFDMDNLVEIDTGMPTVSGKIWITPGYLEGTKALGPPQAFDQGWLASVIPNPEEARLFINRGTAMAPTLVDGDLLLLDTGQKEVYQGQIYTFKLEGKTLMVARLENCLGGKYRISSDNQALFPATEVAETQVEIVGQVLWSGHRF